MESFILTVDQSTSATKAILFDITGRLCHRCDASHNSFYPQPGWVGQDAGDIFRNTVQVIESVMRETGTSREQVKVLALTNQRETVVVWDRHTGRPIDLAIGWQCRRAADICKEIASQGYGPLVKTRTGLVLSPYFSAAKISWLLENVPDARVRAEQGDLLAGTMDSWLVWNLTGGQVHATDYSNASRTQLFNLRELCWDEDLLRVFRIPASMMPEVRASDTIFGTASSSCGLAAGLPIAGIMGDSHAALFGQNCFEPGMAKATYGTGSSIMMNIGREPLESTRGLVTSIAWKQGGAVDYVFEGNINCTGATIKWLVDDLQLIQASREAGPLAASVDSTDGVYLVPAFVGLGAPYWDSDARASITGMTRGTKKAHLVRAAEESIAYQIKDVLDLMVSESQTQVHELRTDGGPTRDAFLMQFQADILDTRVGCARIEELSAYGSCLMAGLAVGIWPDKDSLARLREAGQIYVPAMEPATRERLYQGWQEAVNRTLTNRQR